MGAPSVLRELQDVCVSIRPVVIECLLNADSQRGLCSGAWGLPGAARRCPSCERASCKPAVESASLQLFPSRRLLVTASETSVRPGRVRAGGAPLGGAVLCSCPPGPVPCRDPQSALGAQGDPTGRVGSERGRAGLDGMLGASRGPGKGSCRQPQQRQQHRPSLKGKQNLAFRGSIDTTP